MYCPAGRYLMVCCLHCTAAAALECGRVAFIAFPACLIRPTPAHASHPTPPPLPPPTPPTAATPPPKHTISPPQLIAHDKEVYDIAWGGVGVFASVSADGSVRVFDLRDKEHSTIIYESPQPDTPLLRLAWNKQASEGGWGGRVEHVWVPAVVVMVWHFSGRQAGRAAGCCSGLAGTVVGCCTYPACPAERLGAAAARQSSWALEAAWQNIKELRQLGRTTHGFAPLPVYRALLAAGVAVVSDVDPLLGPGLPRPWPQREHK